ncbi:MAG: trigger factor [Verrucomicrobia bacterium]|nr:trigger factor [Verrucomicrobiota bacterium]
MNVTVENLAPCKKLVRFEVDAKAVDEAFGSVTKDFVKQAKMPGFRPGKAPEAMVAKQYAKDIEEEVKRKLIGESYRQGMKDQKLNVVGYPDIEEIQFGRGQALQFAATVEINPEFELPDYRAIPAKREPAVVSDEDVEKAIDALRGQAADFKKVDREVKEGDYVVINYTGTSDGKPLTEIAPTARGLTEQKGFWVEVKPDSFIPGFAIQLVGAKAGEKRTVNVDFPAEFVTPQLAGKKGVYEVEVAEVKEKALPELNDAFAKTYGAENLDKLREGVRKDLQNEVNSRQKRSIRNQIVKTISEKVSFDMPETTLQIETRNVVYEMVSENQRRGVPKELIEQKKDEIYNAATGIAKERLKISYLFHKISEKEGIRADQNEMNTRITLMAQANQMAPQKFLQELEKRGGVAEVYQQLIHEKVLDFLHENASIEDVPAGSLAQS